MTGRGQQPSSRGRGGDVPPWLLDLLSAAAVTLILAFVITLGYGGQRAADPVAYLFAAGFGALMLLRRRCPVLLLGATALATVGYHALDYPPIGVAVPLAAALFVAADAGALWSAIITGALLLACSFAVRVHEGESAAYLAGYEGVSNVAIIMTTITLGSAVRARRVRLAQQAEIIRLTAEQSARRTELEIRGEREKLSRDLHDTIGHTMSVISIQAGVAAEAIGRDDQQARTAVETIRQSSTRALREVRTMARLLRDDASAEQSVLSLTGLPSLVEDARSAGVEVDCAVDATLDQLPPAVDSTAFRVVQEALTNVVRHAGATRASVAVTTENGVVSVRVSDNGTRRRDSSATGQGIAGMRERVRLLGGTLTASRRDQTGFVVDARIPMAATE
ncbi:sensor histidine kinase [Nocardia goodfellowii]